MSEIKPDYIAKIEGHGKLTINFLKDSAKLEILEGERLFEGLLIGNNFYDIPLITSRICGICPTAHYLAAVKGIEAALSISPTTLTIQLRKLMLTAQIIQSHLLHLYFLALPDYYDIDSPLGVSKQFPTEFALILDLKKYTDDLLTLISGRPIHPISPVVGGFAKMPNKDNLQNLIFGAKKIIEKGELFVKIIADLDFPKLEQKNQYIALNSPKSYAYYSGLAQTSEGDIFSPPDFQNQIKEVVRENSTAKFGQRASKSLFVGALARINLNHQKIHPKTKLIIKKYHLKFPSYNPFHNLIAQSLEILHFLEEIELLLNQVVNKNLQDTPQKPKKHSGFGVGFIEAPRGTLYHQYKIKDDITVQADIVTPTVQNLTSIENDANSLLNTTKDKSQKEREKLCEMLIRAYDPCITCSVH